MQRRDLLKGGAAGLLAGAMSPAQAADLPTIRWRLASSFPKSLDTIYGASEKLAERLHQITDGRFQLRVFAGGEIVPGLQVLDAVQKGTVECGHSASYYYVGKNMAFAFDCALPFGLTARQVRYALQQAAIRTRVCGFDMNGVSPVGDAGGRGALTACRFMLEMLKGIAVRKSGIPYEIPAPRG